MHTRGKLNRGGGALWAVAILLGVAGGCSTDTELGGVRIPNAAPDTRVSGQPPTLLEASYAVEFRWTGADPDGRIRGFQWKLSDNGTDGISPQDTLTVDPLTGAVIHPWRFTASTDSTFVVLADQPGFPGDPPTIARSFRSHSLFVRAVDDKGSVDPSPAYISFTSTTIVPTCRATFPTVSPSLIAAAAVPPTVNMGVIGDDPDFELRVPTKYRTLWIEAKDSGGNWITSKYRYNQIYAEVLSFDNPLWTEWRPYLPNPEDRMVSQPGLASGSYFFFATQVQDTAGAVSVGLNYQTEVANVVVSGGSFRPSFTVSETYLGLTQSTERIDPIAGGQPLNFSWTTTAADYNGTIASMRHGWDIIDANDPNDPGWAVPPGLGEQNREAIERSFSEGLHTFVLRVEDDSQIVRVMKWTLRVIPYVDRNRQLPLLVLDQLYDRDSATWPSRDGRPLNRQEFRNAYWHFLAEGAGGVGGMNWARDWKDHSVAPIYEDLVGYKAVLCYATTGIQTMFTPFRPDARTEKFVWLTPYQQQGGNFMLVGASSMESFLQQRSDYMTPLVFDTREDPNFTIFGESFVTGFGILTLPNGTIVQRGPRMYPYATAGIAALDWTSPSSKHVYGRASFTSSDRNRLCAGLRGLVLAPEFKATHLVGPGVMPDTMYTNPEIDWRDRAASAVDTLSLFDQAAFPFDNDEFVDANITTRTTPIMPQECSGEAYANANVPNGLCIEPMFTGIARIDWMREQQWANGHAEWPQSQYSAAVLNSGCGPMALTEYAGRPQSGARTNGKVFGYLSYKMVPRKPYQVADVYWGFDPYRFDGEGSRKAIRWVLQYFGLQINQ